MARTWLSIRVELVHGRGEDFWPRPGRIFAAARRHTFARLAEAVDDAFARWDRAHLHAFTLADGTRLTTPHIDWEEAGPALDDRETTLGRLRAAEQFVYVFDFGDDWTHLCTVGAERIDPLDELGVHPDGPLPYWGWGDGKTRRCGLSWAIASLVAAVPRVTRRVTGRFLRALAMICPRVCGGAGLAPAAGLIRSLSALEA